MLPFGRGGTRLELSLKVLFKSSTISSASYTFMCNDEEASCWIKLFHNTLLKFYFPSILLQF
jgi:hypothetical protein